MAERSEAEVKELSLVQKYGDKILVSSNRPQAFQDLLQKALAPIILKGASQHASVREKVFEFVQRLKPHILAPEVILPVAELLKQYKTTESSALKHLDLLYIRHSLERLEGHERTALIPTALSGLCKDRGLPQANSFFVITCRLLLDAKLPTRGSQEDADFRASIGLSDPEDAEYLADLIGIIIRLRGPSSAHPTWLTANSDLGPEALGKIDLETEEALKLLRNISILKNKLIAFLGTAAFTSEEKLLPAIYGAVSLDNQVAGAGEELLKRSSVNLEDGNLIRKLFYAHNHLGVPYRTRILALLSRSIVSVTMQEDILTAVTINLRVADSTNPIPSQQSSKLQQTKLFKAIFQYLAWVGRQCSLDSTFAISGQIIQMMQDFIKLQGWPRPQDTSTSVDLSTRAHAYETMGALCRAGNSLSLDDKLQLGEFLFRSLAEDPTVEAVIHIDGALSTLASSISLGPDHPEKHSVRQMLFDWITTDDTKVMRSPRHAVVKWANECLPFDDFVARWIDITAIAGRRDERSDVVEQGRKGLDPWTYRVRDSKETFSKLPAWKEMVVAYFCVSVNDLPTAEAARLVESRLYQTLPLKLDNFSGERQGAFAVAIKYIKNVILLTALHDFEFGPNWEPTLDASLTTSIKSRNSVKEYLKPRREPVISMYLRACLDGALLKDSLIIEECLQCFDDVASLCPKEALDDVAELMPKMFSLIQSNDKSIRSLAAKAFGMIAASPAHSDISQLKAWGRKLMSNFEVCEGLFGSSLNAAEGSILALSHLDSRLVWSGRPSWFNEEMREHLFLLDQNSSQPSLLDAATVAFSEQWSALTSVPEAGSVSGVGSEWKIPRVIDDLLSRAKKGNERAIIALGRLALAIEDDWATEPDLTTEAPPEEISKHPLQMILNQLFKLHELKQVEVHFAIGGAITAAIARWDSDHMNLLVDVERNAEIILPGTRTELMKAVLNKLFKDCKDTKPSLLRASGIWLFSILQYCSHLPEVQTSLRQAQAAFMPLLNARDELVQETASRGLSLIYERGDDSIRSTLVADLVASFTGSGSQLKVEDDTELFEAGALPTGEGKSVTSYKDIVSLANEVGDQGLVYKFMALAQNAATWTTRSAFGRFGLSNILSDSDIDPKIYPKLYRYRFDPNTNVQKSMNNIWKAVVKDPAKVLDEHFEAIISDLVENLHGRDWRVRQASCEAIADLLPGQPFKKYEGHYKDIWAKAMKVMDDAKSTVRSAAAKLCRTLSNTLVRLLEQGGNGSAASAMIREALPFLLSQNGVENPAEDVQNFSISTVIEITKHGGKALKPYIPELIPQLLNLLTVIEPPAINYVYQRLGEEDRETVDKKRSQLVGSYPLFEATENCLRLMDGDIMSQFVAPFEKTIRAAIGLPTKIGCSKVIQTLCTRHIEDVKSVAPGLLKLMEKQTLDKNDQVSLAFAAAAAYLLRHVSSADKRKFCKRVIEKYMKADDEMRRQKIADIVLTIGKVSSDHFNSLESTLLPISYLGAHDTNEYVSKAFTEVWEAKGTSRTVLRYVSEITQLADRCLETQHWSLRHTGALTTAAMVTDIASATELTGGIGMADLRTVWPVFEKTLALKTFDGKRKLLEAFAKFVKNGKQLWKEDDDVAKEMTKIVLREAKRNNDGYRPHAFKLLWKYASIRDDLDLLPSICDIVKPHLETLKTEDKMDVDHDDNKVKQDASYDSAKSGFEAVVRGYQRSKMPSVLGDVYTFLGPYITSEHFAPIRRETWYACAEELFAAAESLGKDKTVESGAQLFKDLSESLDLTKHDIGLESQRLKRASAFCALTSAKRHGIFGPMGQEIDETLREITIKAMNDERSLEVKQAWSRALDCLEKMDMQ